MCNCPTICHLNDCSIFVCISSLKFAVLGTVSYIYEFDIICVTKTCLKSSVLNNLRLPDFCFLFGFEPNCHGCGVFERPTMCHMIAIFSCVSRHWSSRGIRYSVLYLRVLHYLCYRNLAKIFCFKKPTFSWFLFSIRLWTELPWRRSFLAYVQCNIFLPA